jgi:hypothetical protein
MNNTMTANLYQCDRFGGALDDTWPLRHDAITFPWEVPEETVVVEFDNGYWRVVPHRGVVRTFTNRDDALEWARMVASIYLAPWRIVEIPPAQESRRRSA